MTFDTLSEAYLGTLKHVWDKPQYYTSPRGFPIRERVDYSFSVTCPTSSPIVTADAERNQVIARYTEKEIALYESGSRDGAEYAKLAKFWASLLNPDGTINSAYGFLTTHDFSYGDPRYEYWEQYRERTDHNPDPDWAKRSPFDWCKMSLAEDKDSRQAVMQFAKREHFWKGNKDLVCTMHMSFRIRDNALQATVVMRSNDLVKGTVYDTPFFIRLQEKMLASLRPTYPDLELGTYTHFAHSLHIYDRDKDLVVKMLGDS